MEKKYPSYLNLLEDNSYVEIIAKFKEILKECKLCPHECSVDRTKGETGICKSTDEIKVSSAFLHYGEETPISGYNGSGTIFLSNCSLRCLFCQNFDISHFTDGKTVNPEQLASMMLYLEHTGGHNINFVTPTHYISGIVEAIFIAAKNGFKLPVVYNSSGYDSPAVIEMLNGIIDIYMPDFKFSDKKIAQRLTTAPDYFEVASEAIKTMYSQVGDLSMDKKGIAQKGLLIRHLVMPDSITNSKGVFKYIAENISSNTYVNIMAQFRPCYEASKMKNADRRITSVEYKDAIDTARKYGLSRGF